MTEIGYLGAANGDDHAHFYGCGDRRHRLQVPFPPADGVAGPQVGVQFRPKLAQPPAVAGGKQKSRVTGLRRRADPNLGIAAIGEIGGKQKSRVTGLRQFSRLAGIACDPLTGIGVENKNPA
jgi:hypothetical protein